MNCALLVAATRELDVAAERQNQAQLLYEEQLFTVEADHMTVFDSEAVGTVNFRSMKCMCIAASHGVECVCVLTAKLYQSKMQSTEYNEVAMHEQESTEMHQDQPVDNTDVALHVTKKQKFGTMLDDINAWYDKAETIPPDVFEQAQQLHSRMFGRYRRVYRNKTITPLHPYRKAIQRAKLCIMDHTYNQSKLKKTLKQCPRTATGSTSFAQKRKKSRTPFTN